MKKKRNRFRARGTNSKPKAGPTSPSMATSLSIS